MTKKPKQGQHPHSKKTPRELEHSSYKQNYPKWKFSKFDKTHDAWGVGSQKWDKVIEALMGYERMTWGDIETASGGKNKGSNSHFLPIDGMQKNAKQRIKDLKLQSVGKGIEELFSLRISSKHRLVGILEDDGSFFVLWNDVEHEVWPV